MNMFVPYVTEQTTQGEKTQDVFSRLLKDRIVFIDGAIGKEVRARDIVAQLLFLDSQKQTDIYLYINSPGGSITEGMGIYDTMKSLKSDVVTIGYGCVASMGTFLLGSGTKGKRYALPHTDIMIHQPLGGAEGQATEIEIAAKRIANLKNRLYTLQAEMWGRTYEEIYEACERDNWKTAQEAKEFGIIDQVYQQK